MSWRLVYLHLLQVFELFEEVFGRDVFEVLIRGQVEDF
jgi:hypothetical protein